MRTLLLILVTLIAAPTHAEITAEVDRFTGNTKITRKSVPTADGIGMPVYLHVRQGKDRTTGFMLLVRNKSWKYLRCNSLAWLVDGKPVKLPAGKHNGNVRDGGVTEFLNVVPIDEKQIHELATASKIEYRICNDEFTFSDGDLADLREFSRLIKETP